MGQTQSSASLPSKELLLAKTKGGTALVNELFQWMISQANIRDFYLMANPVHCKRYIMLTADALNKVFYKIDIAPQEGPKGTIFFRKINQTPYTNIVRLTVSDSLSCMCESSRFLLPCLLRFWTWSLRLICVS